VTLIINININIYPYLIQFLLIIFSDKKKEKKEKSYEGEKLYKMVKVFGWKLIVVKNVMMK
jgi:hypothetical protein